MWKILTAVGLVANLSCKLPSGLYRYGSTELRKKVFHSTTCLGGERNLAVALASYQKMITGI